MRVGALNELFKTGTHSEFSDRLNRKIILVNKVGLTVALTSLPYIFIFKWAQLDILAVLMSIYIVAYASVVPLNRLGYVHFSRLLFIIATNLAAFSCAFMLSASSGIQMALFITCTFPFVLFEISEKKRLVFCLALPIVLMTAFDIHTEFSAPLQPLSGFASKALYHAMTYSVLILLIVVTFCFYSINYQAEERLRRDGV